MSGFNMLKNVLDLPGLFREERVSLTMKYQHRSSPDLLSNFPKSGLAADSPDDVICGLLPVIVIKVFYNAPQLFSFQVSSHE